MLAISGSDDDASDGDLRKGDGNNRTVADRIDRYRLRCNYCRPHKGENKNWRSHPETKPRYKDHR